MRAIDTLSAVGWTNGELAILLGTSDRTISKYASEARALRDRAEAARAARADLADRFED